MGRNEKKNTNKLVKIGKKNNPKKQKKNATNVRNMELVIWIIIRRKQKLQKTNWRKRKSDGFFLCNLNLSHFYKDVFRYYWETKTKNAKQLNIFIWTHIHIFWLDLSKKEINKKMAKKNQQIKKNTQKKNTAKRPYFLAHKEENICKK